MEPFFWIITLALFCVLFFLIGGHVATALSNEKIRVLEDKLGLKDHEIGTLGYTIKKLTSQKKSSEVRLGQISENSLGFITELPYNFQNMRHLGSPIDYVYFDFDNSDGLEIVILEIKSGSSRKSKRQRQIKEAVALGRVRYEEVRLSSTGIQVG